MPASMDDFADLCEMVASTSSRKRKVEFIAGFLDTLDSNEIKPAILLLLGRPFPEMDSRKLDVGYVTIEKVQSGARQSTLFDEKVMLVDVIPMLYQIADSTGPGSRKVKENLLRNLFGRLSPLAGKYLKRSLYREMRIGASEGVILEGIARASGKDLEEVKRANMILGDIGRLAEMALAREEFEISARMFVPIRPMLAETAESVDVALRIMGKAAFEYKLDGVRVQVHKDGDEVRVFSRRLTEVTESLVEILEMAKAFPERRYIVEGEVVAYRERPLPFQDLMRRFRRINEVEEMSKIVPIRLFLFDILLRGQRDLMSIPYQKRYEELASIFPADLLAPRIVTSSYEKANEFYEKALEDGHEGVIAKELDSQYTMGKRGRKWLKIKRSHTLDLVIVAAEWGHGRRRGWLSDYYLAAVEGSGFSVVGKTFKGLTDTEFEWMTRRLLELKIEEEDYVVTVQPRIVVEVAFDEVQASSKYPSKMSLRFARIKAIREDKPPEDADTFSEVERIYNLQFDRKERFETDAEL
ncbi:MAG: ATP-dependent DNA ligase [Methanomassiliicoccales archaeon]|nr:ATP-dependent DNA ligase [Methanomassiliicoccales archaeon]NYT14805.1 ATP-dependent DNA ligase [Methanomassiliicoccales archaeon]